MSTKWKKNKSTEGLGVHYISRVISECNCIMNKVDGSNDVGLDGYIEFVEQESVTGLCIGVQIKAGNSFLSRNKQNVYFKSDKKHFNYWAKHTLPIVGIVYIPQDNSAYWVDITRHLVDNPHFLTRGPYTIHMSQSNLFDSTNFKAFHTYFLNYKDTFKEEWNFGRALGAIADYSLTNRRIDGLKSLFYFHRNKRAAWHYLVLQFRVEPDNKVQTHFLYYLRHLVSNGDIFWHKNNIIEDDVARYARALVSSYYSIEEIKKMLLHIDRENGISRTSFGINAYLLIDLIPDRVNLLIKIIRDLETCDHTRSWAGIILINIFQKHDLDRAINFAESMYTNFPKSTYHKMFMEIHQTLVDFKYIDFTG